jgi:hypothetical protein
MKNKTKVILLESPAILLLIICFFVSIYVKIKGVYPLSWGTPILFGIVLASYALAKRVDKKDSWDIF